MKKIAAQGKDDLISNSKHHMERVCGWQVVILPASLAFFWLAKKTGPKRTTNPHSKNQRKQKQKRSRKSENVITFQHLGFQSLLIHLCWCPLCWCPLCWCPLKTELIHFQLYASVHIGAIAQKAWRNASSFGAMPPFYELALPLLKYATAQVHASRNQKIAFFQARKRVAFVNSCIVL